MKSASVIVFLTALATLRTACAHDERLGEHPAVLQARAWASAGYDYASKFYPHPAWLYLLPREPERGAADRADARPNGTAGTTEDRHDANIEPHAAPPAFIAGPGLAGRIDAPAIFYRVPRRTHTAGASQ
jgi:hypothetical protein